MLTPEERLEQIEKVLDDLEELSGRMPVIVEGAKDVEALKRLGVERNVHALHTGDTVFAFCEEISREWKHAVILTDWDRRGGHLARMLKDGFVANGVKPNDQVRARLVILSKKEVKDIESLPTFIERLTKLASQPPRLHIG